MNVHAHFGNIVVHILVKILVVHRVVIAEPALCWCGCRGLQTPSSAV